MFEITHIELESKKKSISDESDPLKRNEKKKDGISFSEFFKGVGIMTLILFSVFFMIGLIYLLLNDISTLFQIIITFFEIMAINIIFQALVQLFETYLRPRISPTRNTMITISLSVIIFIGMIISIGMASTNPIFVKFPIFAVDFVLGILTLIGGMELGIIILFVKIKTKKEVNELSIRNMKQEVIKEGHTEL